ncbi:hypothetical protein [Oceanobacter mangrovi]|uniref:hypothetical protein n=1 Tax=Oceanobacter mangrovi TaxID=2862510 RepID=UPI001C8E8C59|nr:hypothetical protein [Oceanobacter mangrovi]
MKNTILMIVLTLFSGTSFANKETDYLIEGCKQLANMYDNRSDLNFLNNITLSPSDTLMAGYCKGVIDSFISFASVRAYRCGRYNNEYCQKQLCSESNWYNIAKKIALKEPESDIDYNESINVEDIIVSGCQ